MIYDEKYLKLCYNKKIGSILWKAGALEWKTRKKLEF